MSLRSLLLLCALALSCQPVATCRTDADCAPDGVCTAGLCALAPVSMSFDAGRPDGGTDAGRQDAGVPFDGGQVDSGTPVDAGLPMDSGVDAGVEDAGAVDASVMDAGLPFDAGSCQSCPDGFACDETLVRCTPQVIALRFVRPDANDVFGAGRPVRLEVLVELDASVPLPSTLQVTSVPSDFAAPVLALQSGQALWAVDTVTPADSGVFALTARLVLQDAGFFEASTTLTVDARRPVVQLFAEPPALRVNDGGFSDRDPVSGFATAYKKDELVELRVESTVPVTAGPADFGLPPQSLTARMCTSCPANRSCQCFTLDLARVRFDAFRGALDAGVGPLSDALGNVSAPANVSLSVTRWKWRRALLEPNEAGLDVLHPPALDDDGRVHVATGYTANTRGALWQMLPTGETRVDVAIDEVQGAPIVVGRTLWAQGENVQMRRYDTVQMSVAGTALQSTGPNICSNDRWEGLSSVVDTRLFLLGTNGRVYTGTPTSTMTCDSWGTQPICCPIDYFAPRGVMVAQAFAGTAARLFYGRPEMRTSSGMMRVDYYPAAVPNFQQERAATNPQGTTSLAVFDDVVASTSRIATPRNTVAISVWNAELSARVDGRIAGDAGTSYGPLVVQGPRTQPTFVFGDGVGSLRRFPYSPPPMLMPDGGVLSAELPPIPGVDALEGGSLGAAAPVLGANGLAYLVSPATGRLTVVNLSTGLVEWTAANAFVPGAVSPALDVLRDRSLAKQCSRGAGLLYVAVRNDSALTAVVVDSPGLDATSPWPRFHHDNGNTGNPETPLTPWSCP